MKYGYIDENGFLIEKEIREIEEMGMIYEEGNPEGAPGLVTVSVEDQIIQLVEQGWKPVDEIEIRTCENNYMIEVIPINEGSHISFEYREVFNQGAVDQKIRALKKNLSDSDYKIIKCYELSLIGQPLPYNIEDMHAERQALRDEINRLEGLMT